MKLTNQQKHNSKAACSKNITSTISFFSALAISDLLFVLTSIPRGVRVATQQTYFILYPVVKFFNHFAYTTSIYLTVTLIIERYLAFIKGSRAVKYFSKLGQHRIKWVIGFVISSAFLYNVPVMFEFNWDTEAGNGVTKTEFARNPMYESVYKAWMFFTVEFVIPTACLAIFSGLLIREVRVKLRFSEKGTTIDKIILFFFWPYKKNSIQDQLWAQFW